MLSNTCKYAIRAVIYISIHDDGVGRIGIKQISKELELPTPFLGKILQVLAKNKILVSTKGPHGGFAMASESNEKSLYDIVKIFDGEDVFQNCMIGLEFCKQDPTKVESCPFHTKSGPVRDELSALFSNQTIGELAADIKNLGAGVTF